MMRHNQASVQAQAEREMQSMNGRQSTRAGGVERTVVTGWLARVGGKSNCAA